VARDADKPKMGTRPSEAEPFCDSYKTYVRSREKTLLMIRKSIRKLGVWPTCLAVTAVSVLCSVLLYLIISHIQDRVTYFGVIRAVIIPGIIATPITFFFLKFLRRLDLTEESLRASEERYRRVLEAAPDSITITRVKDGRYLEVNNAFCELSGYTRGEALGKTPAELDLFVNPTDRERFLQVLRERGEVADFDVQYQMLDGTIHDTILSAKPLQYREEECLITIATVITERKRAQEALRESEERYRLLAENVTDIIWIRDMDLKIKYVSPSVKRITGFSVEESMGGALRGFFTPASVELGNRALAEELAAEAEGDKDPFRTRNLELEGRRKDGAKIWTEEKVGFLRDSKGKPIGLLGVTRDITERKQAEMALQQSEERYRSLVENTLDGFFMCEIPSGRFLFLNQRSSELFGYSQQEGLRLTVWDMVSPEERGHIRDRIQERLEGRDSGNARQIFTLLRKDGSTIRAEISTSLVTYREKPSIQGVVRDVSEQERLQQQLERAQRMEAIGTLAGGIAHDFNNLLMAIQGNASLLLFDGDIPDAHRERIAKIEQYVHDGADLTRQLLGFAKGGKYEARPSDLNETIHKTCEMFGRAKKEIKIHTRCQEDIWAVEVDRGQIEQVLLNLYVNAWQAMPGSGDLYLETRNVGLSEEEARRLNVKPGNYVKISVADTGVGMDEATQRRIFDPFFTTKEMGRGTGLGLASAYGIIKNHDGMIDVYSKVGQGSTFHIYLPASRKKILPERDVAEEISRGSETLLIVDDEEIIVDVGVDMLKSLGYTVLSAGGGREAIEIYKNRWHGIDLVILDMIMPDMNGGEVYDRLKEINPDIKVLLSSGYSMDSEAKDVLTRGCDGFIQKPFSLNVISRKLREIIHRTDQGFAE